MKFGWRKLVRAVVMVICSIALIVAARLWYLEEQGNFHPITHGEVYRSAQLDRDELAYYIRKFKIRSMINLRGEKDGEPWYEEEVSTSRRLGARHFDLGLSPDRAPSSHETEGLLRLFQLTPRPVLIHCKAGADRSGLAAAIWRVVIDGDSASAARMQLSILYGHMPVGPTQELDAFFETWVKARKVDSNDLAGSLAPMTKHAAKGK